MPMPASATAPIAGASERRRGAEGAADVGLLAARDRHHADGVQRGGDGRDDDRLQQHAS